VIPAGHQAIYEPTKKSTMEHQPPKKYSDVVKEGTQRKYLDKTLDNHNTTHSPKGRHITTHHEIRNHSRSISPPPDTPPSPSFFQRDLIQNRRKPTDSTQFWEISGKRKRSLEEGEREERGKQHREKTGKTSI
ncbi:Hypothetical predicted protein, partial [Pelobates cultripes]